jgi:hypothetical protein
MSTTFLRCALFGLLLVGADAFADNALADKGSWETVSRSPLSIRQRTWSGTQTTEIEVRGTVRAKVEDVEAVLLDCDGAPRFMPYLKECWHVGAPRADGTYDVYSRIAPPLVSSRDYVLRMDVTRWTPASGSFRQAWSTSTDHPVPARKGIVRLETNEGEWNGSAQGEETLLVYRLAAASGGISPRLVRMTTKSSMSDLYRAVEREAQRRAKARAEG